MKPRPKELTIRLSEEGDTEYLTKWFQDPKILHWFPMDGDKEINDSVRIWQEYIQKQSALTALWNGEPCGMTVLYLQQFKKIAHTCLFSIIVQADKRGLGIGSALLEELMLLAKNTFQIEILHLEVYDGNPAKRLYEKLGFTPFGVHDCFTKEFGECRRKIFMEKYLIGKRDE